MAVDRKQQMKEITERLEQGVKDIFTSEMYTTYLRTMAKFHNYSFNNTLLIAMQRPDATLVAGFNAWKNKFNRCRAISFGWNRRSAAAMSSMFSENFQRRNFWN